MLPVVEHLLSRKDLDINNPDGKGCTYLDQLFHEGLFESAGMKLAQRWDMPKNWFEKALKQNPRNISKERPEMSYLHTASVLGRHQIESSILRCDSSKAFAPEFDGMNLLERYAFHGIEHGLMNILPLLQNSIIQLSDEQQIKLLQLCAQQDWESIVYGLKDRLSIDIPDADESGRTLAHWASELHWTSITSLVANKPKAWLNHKANDGRTALHVAVEHRNRLACGSLLQAGADYMVRDRRRRLPVHIAAEEGHRSIVLLLLEQPRKSAAL